MRHLTFSKLVSVALVSVALPATAALAHEGHQMKCEAASIQSMKMDVQAMNDGQAKTTAMKEIKLAEDMMNKKDSNACTTHLGKAMEAMEK